MLDGLNEAASKLSWTINHKIPTLKYIFHVCDAPPHGKEYGGYSYTWGDGCPCGLTIEKVSHLINMKEIHYRLIKCGRKLDKMS